MRYIPAEQTFFLKMFTYYFHNITSLSGGNNRHWIKKCYV